LWDMTLVYLALKLAENIRSSQGEYIVAGKRRYLGVNAALFSFYLI
jgi:hypothetical protein